MLWEIWIILASIFSIASGVLAGVLANYTQELFNKHKRINKLTISQRAFIILIIFIASVFPKALIDWQQSREFKAFSATSKSSSNPTTSIAIREGVTEQFYNENLLISIKDINCSNDTPYVNFIVGSVGFQANSLNSIEIGNVSLYKGEDNYELRLSRINCFVYKFVEFRITKLKQIPEPLIKTPTPLVNQDTIKGQEYLQLQVGDKKLIFNNEITFKFVKVNVNKATFELISPGYPNKVFITQKGDEETYQGRDKFIIKVVDVDYSLDNADFLVTQMKKQ